MTSLFILLSALVLANNALVAVSDDTHNGTIKVSAPIGPIQGSLMTSRLGNKIYAFRGVPYAEPPTGQHRFQPPVPVTNWTEVLNATEEGPSCVSPFNKNWSEDCLRLNIYSTKLPSNDSESEQMKKRPVIVFFHPGGFYAVSAQSHIYGPQYLMDHEIVLVTVNYRLASLGFMSTGDPLVPGNLGLKDQVQALRWVKDNIATFGGDPDCVTISGYSAGSWSVSLHLLSPMTKGLFHRAIIMSGAPTYQKLLPKDQKHLALKQAELLGCPIDSVGNLIICLNTKTAEEFANSTSKFFEWYGDPILVWTPVVEPEVKGVERYLTGQPADLIRKGEFHHVPVLTGISKDEFGGNIVRIIQEAKGGNDSILQDLIANWTTIAPISFLYERDTNRTPYITEELKKFYFNDKPISLENLDGLAKLYADAVIIFPHYRYVTLLAEAALKSIYYYRFSYQGRYSHITWNNGTPYGVVHHDELIYIFRVSYFPEFEPNTPEITALERWTTLWSHFASTGEPFPKDSDLFKDVVWDTFTDENRLYLDFGSDLVMKTGLYQDRMDFWDKLFPLPPIDEDDECD